MPTPGEMEVLGLAGSEPVMESTRRTYTADGTLIEYARGIHSTSRFSWTYTFETPDRKERGT